MANETPLVHQGSIQLSSYEALFIPVSSIRHYTYSNFFNERGKDPTENDPFRRTSLPQDGVQWKAMLLELKARE